MELLTGDELILALLRITRVRGEKYHRTADRLAAFPLLTAAQLELLVPEIRLVDGAEYSWVAYEYCARLLWEDLKKRWSEPGFKRERWSSLTIVKKAWKSSLVKCFFFSHQFHKRFHGLIYYARIRLQVVSAPSEDLKWLIHHLGRVQETWRLTMKWRRSMTWRLKRRRNEYVAHLDASGEYHVEVLHDEEDE